MKDDCQVLKPMRLRARKNWLWLWLLPAALSWLLVSLARPTGGAAFRVELAIIFSCSGLCGFALAAKSFSTLKQRFMGGLFFTGASLCVIASVVFLGCGSFYTAPQLTAAEAQNLMARRKAQETQRKEQVRKEIVARDSQADSTMLDLTSFYDAPLLLPLDLRSPDIHALAPGTHEWDGVKYDVRARVVPEYQPEGRIAGIPVGQKCSGIAFLLGYGEGLFQTPSGEICGRLVVHFANGRLESIPLVFGKDVARSRNISINPDERLAMTNLVVWARTTVPYGAPRISYALFIKKWINPIPSEPVSAIDLVPQPAADPFLVAITIQPVNP
jgi:hypothetical protein